MVLDKKHEAMLKRGLEKLIERAANNLERVDQLRFEADMVKYSDKSRADRCNKRADELEKEAFSIMDMFS